MANCIRGILQDKNGAMVGVEYVDLFIADKDDGSYE